MKYLTKSRFTIDMPLNNRKEELVALYHTMTGSFTIINKDAWFGILDCPEDPPFSEEILMLREMGFLVSCDIDENVVFDCWKNQHVYDSSIVSSKVLVTRKCNNRCTYCIIEPEAEDMSSRTALEMDAFYCGYIEEARVRSVKDDYLGGEPFLNTEIIMASSSRRFDFCKKRNIDYLFSMTTNGTLLNPSVIMEMKRKGLKNIRVSMAGPAPIHDKLRPSAANHGTYDKIMKNLKAISGMIPITIECQYDSGSDDYMHIPELMDDFEDRGIEIDNIFFTPIMVRRQPGPFKAGHGDPNKALFLVKKARERGYSRIEDAPSNICKADFKSKFVFDTDGSIIPCPSLQKGEMAYGHVSRGIDFVPEAQIISRKLPDKCMSQCPILPICMGGCRLPSLTLEKEFNGIDCQYDTFCLFLEDYIKEMAQETLSQHESDDRVKAA